MSKCYVKIHYYFIIVMLFTVEHTIASENRAHKVDPSNVIEAIDFGDIFFWQTLGPDAFLDFLKQTRTIYYVHGRHIGWLRESDIPFLETLVSSKEECAPIVMTICSVAFPEDTRSTVGNEALFLLEGFRQGSFPPSITSIGFANKHGKDTMEWLKRRERHK